MKKLLALLVTLCVVTPLYAADGTQLLEQIDKNLTPESYDSYRKIINVEPSGRTKEYVYYTAKKGRDKIAGLFLSPASDKGRSTLRLGRQHVALCPQRGKTDPHYQPAIRDRRCFQQRRHSGPRLLGGI